MTVEGLAKEAIELAVSLGLLTSGWGWVAGIGLVLLIALIRYRRSNPLPPAPTYQEEDRPPTAQEGGAPTITLNQGPPPKWGEGEP